MKKAKSAFLYDSLKAVLSLVLLFTFSQCSYDPEIIDKPISLSFSTDTIQFDTLFTGRQSITKRLKIYNPDSKAVMLDEISLESLGQPFELVLNGRRGKSFSDQLLLGKDSLLLLMEATIDQSDANNPFVIRDRLNVTNKDNQQSVVIEAWGQNAHFLNDSILTGNQRWINDKPYVITNSILIDSSSSLTIEEGVKVYSGEESFIYVQGTLTVNGTADSLVLFTNDRLDEPFASSVGQWGGIIFLNPSTNNSIKYADIKNAIVGLNLATYNADGKLDLLIENSKVGNVLTSAILALNADFEATNSLFYNTANGTVAHVGGGSANYFHCTIANYLAVQRDAPAAYFSDYAVDNQDNEIIDPIEVNILNSAVYGRIEEEFIIGEFQAGNVSLAFSNCLFRSSQEALEANNSLLNIDPLFISPFDGDFSISEDSPLIDAALPTNILEDITGKVRDTKPDIGAYEFFVEAD